MEYTMETDTIADQERSLQRSVTRPPSTYDSTLETRDYMAADESVFPRMFCRMKLNLDPARTDLSRINAPGGMPFLLDHDPAKLAGTVIGGDIKGRPGSRQLFCRVAFANTPLGQQALQEYDSGVRPGCSITFGNEAVATLLERDENDSFNDLVEISDYPVLELSGVTVPAIATAGKLSQEGNASVSELPTVQLSLSVEEERSLYRKAREAFTQSLASTAPTSELPPETEEPETPVEEPSDEDSNLDIESIEKTEEGAMLSHPAVQTPLNPAQTGAVDVEVVTPALSDDSALILRLGVEHGLGAEAVAHVDAGGSLDAFKDKLISIRFNSGAQTGAIRRDNPPEHGFRLATYFRHRLTPRDPSTEQAAFQEIAMLQNVPLQPAGDQFGRVQIPWHFLSSMSQRRAEAEAQVLADDRDFNALVRQPFQPQGHPQGGQLAVDTAAVASATPKFVDYARSRSFLIDLAPVLEYVTLVPDFRGGVYHVPFGMTPASVEESLEGNAGGSSDPVLGDILGAAGVGGGLVPRRVTVDTQFYAESLNQTDGFIDQFLRRPMRALINSRVARNAMTGTGVRTATDNPSMGVWNIPGVTSRDALNNGTEITRANILLLMNDIAELNLEEDGMAMVASGGAMVRFALAQIATVGGYLLDDIRASRGIERQMLLGSPAVRHNSLADIDTSGAERFNRMIFGNFSACHVVMFGGLQVINDVITEPMDVKVTFGTMMDSGVVDPRNFKLMYSSAK